MDGWINDGWMNGWMDGWGMRSCGDWIMDDLNRMPVGGFNFLQGLGSPRVNNSNS